MKQIICTKTKLKNVLQAIIGISFAIGLLSLSGTRVQAQIINTYAGNGVGAPNTGAYLGDGGPATNAEFYHSTGVAIDDSGNIYIADSQNDVIRKVEASTGVITTVAGVGGANGNGYNGDGIAATTAKMSDPWGVAVDDSGNIYIADYGNHAIRKVTVATGIISTVAGTPPVATNGYSNDLEDGGQATDAHLAYPIGLGLDDSANIYIADQWDHRVRKVTKKTGIIETLAGTSTSGYNSAGFSGNGGQATNALLAYPSGVVVDDSGNVYIADQWNNEIRVVSQKTGIINDYAGNGSGAPGLYSGAYSGDGGQATAAQLNYATGVGKDDSGNIYIADWANEVIRKVTAKTGIITTVAGNNALGAGFNGDNQPATAAQLSAPSGVTTNACGAIYIADYMNNRVRIVSGVPGTISVSPPTPICSGSSDTLTASGASNYQWSPSTGLSDTTGSVVIANPTITTTYIITGSGGVCVGAATPDTIVVTVTTALPLTVLPLLAPTVCIGQGATLSVQGGGSNFTWTPAIGLNYTTGDSVIATPSVTTTYTVTGTSSGGCASSGIDSVIIIPSQPLLVLPQPGPLFCSGLSAELKVSGGGTNFIWTPTTGLSNTTSGDSVLASPLVTTTYVVTGYDSLGCASSGSEVVTVIASPNKPSFYQHGDTLTSSATTDNQWYMNGFPLNGDTSENLIINNTSPDSFYVVVENEANGCSTSSDTEATTGINQLSVISNQLSIYPNPFNNEIVIDISASAQEIKNWTLQVIDVLGRTVYTQQSLNYINNIDLSDLASGVYFITVINKTGKAVVPVVKQN